MDLPAEWTTDTVAVNGTHIQYYRTGNGPPVVIAHGFYENARCWRRLIADLADDYEIVAYDARAHGRSDAPKTGYDMANRVADLMGIIERCNLVDPILFGHSMGGATVISVGADHPELPRGIVASDPAGFLPSPDINIDELVDVVKEKLEDWSNRSVDNIISDYDDRDPDLACRLAVAHTECRSEIVEIVRTGYPPVSDAFSDIVCPSLVLKSDDDPKKRASELDAAEGLSHGRLVHIPDAGHNIFQDQYETAYRELRTFLCRLSEQG